MLAQNKQQSSATQFSIFGFIRGVLGLSAGSGVLAFVNGEAPIDFISSKSGVTLGDFINSVMLQIVDGYHDILHFFLNLDVVTVIALVVPLVFVLSKLFNRRITTTKSERQFFESTNAAVIPQSRIGYSDRMSYAMGELSELAYLPVEDISHLIAPAVKPINDWLDSVDLSKENRSELDKLLNKVVVPSEVLEEELHACLLKGHFKMVSPYLSNHTLNIDKFKIPNNISSLSAQGFVCYHNNLDKKKSFIVVAFRGSELNVEDWLTNADAQPLNSEQITEMEKKLKSDKEKYGFTVPKTPRIGRIHRGFYGAFLALAPQLMKNVFEAKNVIGDKNCPVYFTGHSLGGAMAIIAARELLPDSNGAVYTFGAPRIGDYNYFNGMKTPIFRVVNSSDIVPRVPPGVFAPLLKAPLYVVRWVFAIRQGVESTKHANIQKVIEAIEKYIDRLSHYRHYGDLRYLTDVSASKQTTAEILSNPSKFDQIFWFFTSIGVSFGKPAKSHSLQIYRNKLAKIAAKRNK